MSAEAISSEQVTESTAPSATEAVGHSLGRAARFATVWLGAVTGSVERVFGRTRPGRPSAAARARAETLLEEMATLVSAQAAEQRAGLVDNNRFWWLVEELYASRYLAASEGQAAEQVEATEVVDAALSEPAKAKGSKKAKGQAAKRAEQAQAEEAPAEDPKPAATADEPAEPADEAAAEPDSEAEPE